MVTVTLILELTDREVEVNNNSLETALRKDIKMYYMRNELVK